MELRAWPDLRRRTDIHHVSDGRDASLISKWPFDNDSFVPQFRIRYLQLLSLALTSISPDVSGPTIPLK